MSGGWLIGNRNTVENWEKVRVIGNHNTLKQQSALEDESKKLEQEIASAIKINNDAMRYHKQAHLNIHDIELKKSRHFQKFWRLDEKLKEYRERFSDK